LFVFRLHDIQRDWGHVKDYIEARWLILQEEEPEDFAIVTGITTPIREFVRIAFAEVGLEFALEGVGVEEVGTVAACNNPEYQLPFGKKVIGVDERYFRPTEVELLIGDPIKAQQKLGWKPKYDLKALCAEMVESDLNIFKKS
jgi:GDPmannose 4,6-dehydratase